MTELDYDEKNAPDQDGGMDGLLTDLEGRISDYKAKHGGLPP